jgi:hypothetical protein
MTIMEIEPKSDANQPPAPMQGQPAQEPAAAQLAGQLLSPQIIDALLVDADRQGLAVDGPPRRP